MATSGSYDFSLTLDELMAEGCERAGVGSSGLGSHQIVSLTRSINLALIDFENMGHTLYRRDRFSQALSNDIRGYRLPEGTIDVLDGSIRNASDEDRKIRRMNASEYTQLPSKETKAEPYSFYVSFDITDTSLLASISSGLTDPSALSAAYSPSAAAGEPILVLYPCPDADSTYSFVGTRLRTHQNAGNLDDEVDINRQWFDAMCQEIAARAAQKYNRSEYAAARVEAEALKKKAKEETGSRSDLILVHSARPSRTRRY